jgi:hypothetical protein
VGADSAVVIVVTPSGGTQTNNLSKLLINGVVVDYRTSIQTTGSDGNTILLMHLDGNLINSGDSSYTVTMSNIAGYSSPNYSSGQTGFGQSMYGNGASTLNGLVANPGSISEIPTPHTVDCWYLLPSADSAQEYTNCVLDLGAGRAIYQIRNAGSGDTNNYMQLNIFDNLGVGRWAYCAIPKTQIFSGTGWHQYRMVYDYAKSSSVRFYLDGNQITTIQGGTPINGEYQHINFPAAVLGRVWTAASPGSNLMPLHGYADELVFSKVDRTDITIPVELSDFNASSE